MTVDCVSGSKGSPSITMSMTRENSTETWHRGAAVGKACSNSTSCGHPVGEGADQVTPTSVRLGGGARGV